VNELQSADCNPDQGQDVTQGDDGAGRPATLCRPGIHNLLLALLLFFLDFLVGLFFLHSLGRFLFGAFLCILAFTHDVTPLINGRENKKARQSELP
jgi:hypothetical protein